MARGDGYALSPFTGTLITDTGTTEEERVRARSTIMRAAKDVSDARLLFLALGLNVLP